MWTRALDGLLDRHLVVALAAGAMLFAAVYWTMSRIRMFVDFSQLRWVAIGGFLTFYAFTFHYHPHHLWQYVGNVALLGLIWGLWSRPAR